MNCSQFYLKAELFNAIRLNYTLQPAALVNFQKNKMKCSLCNIGLVQSRNPASSVCLYGRDVSVGSCQAQQCVRAFSDVQSIVQCIG